MSSNPRRLFLVVGGVFSVLVIGAGLVVFFVVLGNAERASEAERREERERQAAIDLVTLELEMARALPDTERAETVWKLWQRIVEEQWPHYGCCLERMVMDELADIGKPALAVMLESIHEAPSFGSNEASAHLAMFGSDATVGLLEILETSSDSAVQHEALSGLWSCVAGYENTEEEEQAIRKALAPFLDGPDESLKDHAELVLGRLDK